MRHTFLQMDEFVAQNIVDDFSLLNGSGVAKMDIGSLHDEYNRWRERQRHSSGDLSIGNYVKQTFLAEKQAAEMGSFTDSADELPAALNAVLSALLEDELLPANHGITI